MLSTRLDNRANRRHRSVLLCQLCRDNPQALLPIHLNNRRRNKESRLYSSRSRHCNNHHWPNNSRNSIHSRLRNRRARTKSGCLPRTVRTPCKHKLHRRWHMHTDLRMCPSNSNSNSSNAHLLQRIGCTSPRSQRTTCTDFRSTSASIACP